MTLPSLQQTVSSYIRNDDLENLRNLLNNAMPDVVWSKGSVVQHSSYSGVVKIRQIYKEMRKQYSEMAKSTYGLTIRVRCLAKDIAGRLGSLEMECLKLNKSVCWFILDVAFEKDRVPYDKFMTETQFLHLFPNQKYTGIEASFDQMFQLSMAYREGQACVSGKEVVSSSTARAVVFF